MEQERVETWASWVDMEIGELQELDRRNLGLLEDPSDHLDRCVIAIVGVTVFVLMLALLKGQLEDLIYKSKLGHCAKYRRCR